MSDDRLASSSKNKRPAATAPDARDALIERLERAIADEQQKSAALRKANDELRFKLDVLEKSYAKQLEDARRESAEQRSQIVTFRDDTLRLMEETRAVLEHVAAERDRLRAELERPGAPPNGSAARAANGEFQASEGTINELIANPAWANERKPAVVADVQANAGAEPESPSQEMIAPELVFTKDGDDDEGDA